MKGWFSKKKDKTSADPYIGLSLFTIGAVSCSIQLLLMKEAMNIAGGNELIAGIFMGTWLIMSALGAWIGGNTKTTNLKSINLLFSFSPVVSLLFLLVASTSFVHAGETMSFFKSLIFTLIITAPICIASGYAFIKLVELSVLVNRSVPGKSFAMETVGGIFAGVLISIISSGLVNTYLLILLTVLLSFSFTILNFIINDKRKKILFKIFVVLFASSLLAIDPDLNIRNILMSGVEVVSTKDTPYGNISEGRYGGETNLFYDYRLVAYSSDIIEREEDIHFAMLQDRTFKNVLLISGPLNSRLKELSKYDLASVTFIERDPGLIKIAEAEEEYSHPYDLKIKNIDAFNEIKSDSSKYDAIISLVPPPSSLSLSRFYSLEFFRNAKARMTDDAVFLCAPGPGEDYFGDEAVKLYSSIYNALGNVFLNVHPVLGNKLYFIASDGPLSASFSRLSKESGVKNQYVNCNYFIDEFTEEKSEQIASDIDKEIKMNRISNPVASYYYQQYSLSKDTNRITVALIIIILIFALPVISFRRENIYMYFSSTALSGFEIIILFILQITVGNMYRITGTVIATIMAGLAFGAIIGIKSLSKIDVRKRMFGIALYYAIIALVFPYIVSVADKKISTIVIVSLSFLPSIFTGHLFRELTLYNGKGKATSNVYSADLTGSAIGFILISAVAVPLLGLQLSIILLSLMLLTGIFVGSIK